MVDKVALQSSGVPAGSGPLSHCQCRPCILSGIAPRSPQKCPQPKKSLFYLSIAPYHCDDSKVFLFYGGATN
ncbi:hypothetical protein AV530_017698 [Patagioenas fasciata monilis]|uniref:Uncharacterized protein n=1 Tax=Patagioenas fasciata monilis TaxID=372326 RepID=A0A1V4KV94_PATFA|nr:hypothetical protein AV530_017698 [Patagioenas fasciata monilis]